MILTGILLKHGLMSLEFHLLEVLLNIDVVNVRKPGCGILLLGLAVPI